MKDINDLASNKGNGRRRSPAVANKQNTDSPQTATTAAEEVLAEDADIGIADGTSTQLHHEWAMPDLIIIDGGKGQLSAAMEVLQELRIDIPTVGLAKENEEIFTPGSPDSIILPRSSQGLYMVQRIRDEAHRFGITYHRKLRSDRTFKSVLDEIPGIGPKRKQALMKHFGSVRAISAASLEELAGLDGMTKDSAEKVKEYIGRME